MESQNWIWILAQEAAVCSWHFLQPLYYLLICELSVGTIICLPELLWETYQMTEFSVSVIKPCVSVIIQPWKSIEELAVVPTASIGTRRRLLSGAWFTWTRSVGRCAACDISCGCKRRPRVLHIWAARRNWGSHPPRGASLLLEWGRGQFWWLGGDLRVILYRLGLRSNSSRLLASTEFLELSGMNGLTLRALSPPQFGPWPELQTMSTFFFQIISQVQDSVKL